MSAIVMQFLTFARRVPNSVQGHASRLQHLKIAAGARSRALMQPQRGWGGGGVWQRAFRNKH